MLCAPIKPSNQKRLIHALSIKSGMCILLRFCPFSLPGTVGAVFGNRMSLRFYHVRLKRQISPLLFLPSPSVFLSDFDDKISSHSTHSCRICYIYIYNGVSIESSLPSLHLVARPQRKLSGYARLASIIVLPST